MPKVNQLRTLWHNLVTMYLSLNSDRKGARMLRKIFESVVMEDTTEQLDETFDGIARAISLRSAQGMGTDETLSEMLAAITTERDNRGSGY